jgi:hypothetical protein
VFSYQARRERNRVRGSAAVARQKAIGIMQDASCQRPPFVQLRKLTGVEQGNGANAFRKRNGQKRDWTGNRQAAPANVCDLGVLVEQITPRYTNSLAAVAESQPWWKHA